MDNLQGVFVLADGMGGQRCGEVAAELAVRAVREYMRRGQEDEHAWPFGYDPALSSSQNRVVNAVRFANREVWEACQIRPECDGMGSTLSVLLVEADKATAGSIGDSRVYLFRDGRLRLLTRDDAVVFNLLEAGAITPEETKTHPMRNVLTLALGYAEDVTVQLVDLTLKPGDRLLLSSDGLHGVVDDSAIRQTIGQYDDLSVTVERLIDAARTLGGPDNISCIVVDCLDRRAAGQS
jgi:protein phosphatase